MNDSEKKFTSPAKNASIVLPTLSVFLVLSIFSVSFMSYKLVAVGSHVMSAATFVVPLWYLLGDVTTEIYGYKVTRKLIWISLTVTLLFSVILEGLIYLPSPASWQYQADYDHILGHLVRISLSDFIGIFVGGFVNSIALSKWKILLKGKYYWCRSLASSIVGQAVYIVIALTMIFYGMVSNKDLLEIMLASLIAKAIIIVIAVGPVAFCVNLIKTIEKTDVYDYGVNYNPFKIT